MSEEIANPTAVPEAELSNSIFICYGALMTMAVAPIFFASKAAAKVEGPSARKKEQMTKDDAKMFPVYASCALFGLYLLFKYLPKEYVNLALGSFFFLVSSSSFSEFIRPVLASVLPPSFSVNPYRFNLHRGDGDHKKVLIAFELDYTDMVSVLVGVAVSGAYYITKNWIVNNLLGLAFAYSGIKHLSVDSFQVGVMLLSALFFYDIFWVFGTDVMVTVAKSFDAPIKVLFPRDILRDGLTASKLSMLGLGDIVLPGILVALLLRFDIKQNLRSQPHFVTAMIAYIAGLATTMGIMHVFQAAQPALLYLVPFGIIAPILTSLALGQFNALWNYKEAAPEDSTVEPKSDEAKKSD